MQTEPSAQPDTRGRVIELAPYRAALSTERGPDEWDRLARLADMAGTWRDPESLAALAACVARLRAEVDCEWDG